MADQCERNPLCTRGYKHRGWGGHCAFKVKESPARGRGIYGSGRGGGGRGRGSGAESSVAPPPSAVYAPRRASFFYPISHVHPRLITSPLQPHDARAWYKCEGKSAVGQATGAAPCMTPSLSPSPHSCAARQIRSRLCANARVASLAGPAQKTLLRHSRSASATRFAREASSTWVAAGTARFQARRMRATSARCRHRRRHRRCHDG